MSTRPALTPAEVISLLAAADQVPSGPNLGLRRTRNRLILLLMLDAGCRAGELVQLRYPDAYYNGLPRSTLDIRDEIAKYRCGRCVPISDRLAQALESWHSYTPCEAPPPIAPALVYSGPARKPLSRRQVHRIVAALAQKALGRAVYPHMLRHTFIDRLRQVTDLPTTQMLAGHKHLASTQAYCHPTNEQADQAIRRAFNP